MYTKTLVSEKPRWTWEKPFKFSVAPGGLKEGTPTFVANLATAGNVWSEFKMRHIGGYYVVRKIAYAIALAALIGAGTYAIWWFVTNIGWDYRAQSHWEYVDVSPSSPSYTPCDYLDYASCRRINQEHVRVVEWVPYWDWFTTTIKHLGRGTVAFIGFRLVWMSALPLFGTLKSLYTDLRTRFARTKGEARHFNVYRDRLAVFENALADHIKQAGGTHESSKSRAKTLREHLQSALDRITKMSVEEFNTEVGELSEQPITPEEVLSLFRSSIGNRRHPVLTVACDAAASRFIVGSEELWEERNSSTTSRDERERLGKQINAIAKGQSSVLVEVLTNAIVEKRIQAAVDEAQSLYLLDRRRADKARRINELIASTNYLT